MQTTNGAAAPTTNGTLPTHGALAVVRPEETTALARGMPLLTFTPEQEEMIRNTFLSGASKAEASVLMEVARLRGLNPITRQIHFVKRWDSAKGAEVWAHQVSIDGLRFIAERTGKYDGQDEPETVEHPQFGRGVKVKVFRKDISRPFVGVAYWKEFSQTKKGGELLHMWAKYPFHMLAKCAEALALRKAFPEDMAGLYTDDEMPSLETTATPTSGAPTHTVTPANPRSGRPDAQPPVVAAAVVVRPDDVAHRAVAATVDAVAKPDPDDDGRFDGLTGETTTDAAGQKEAAFVQAEQVLAACKTKDDLKAWRASVKAAIDAGAFTDAEKKARLGPAYEAKSKEVG